MSMVYCSCKSCGKPLLLDSLEAAQHGYLCDACIAAGNTADTVPGEDRSGPYVVVVIDECSLVKVKQVGSLKEGVLYANEWLNGILKDYDDEGGDKSASEIEDDLAADKGVKWEKATRDKPNAWCSYRGHWDAVVCKMEM